MVSFGELLLIALVGLLVIGPRRLPETVRFVALQMGRLRQAVTQTRKVVEDELGLDEIRRQLHNEQVMRSLQATREEIERVGKGLPPNTQSEPDSTTADEKPGELCADDSESSRRAESGNENPDHPSQSRDPSNS